MLHHMLSNRSVLAVLVFCVLSVGGSLCYHWHIRRITDADVLKRIGGLFDVR